jgi:hypothetical protein
MFWKEKPIATLSIPSVLMRSLAVKEGDGKRNKKSENYDKGMGKLPHQPCDALTDLLTQSQAADYGLCPRSEEQEDYKNNDRDNNIWQKRYGAVGEVDPHNPPAQCLHFPSRHTITQSFDSVVCYRDVATSV